MENKLPKVYVNPIDHEINNSQRIYKSNMSENFDTGRKVSIDDIDKIINDRHHILKSKVRVVMMDNNIKNKILVSRINDELLFMDGEKINVRDIKEISLK